jgi:hypothetical protein
MATNSELRPSAFWWMKRTKKWVSRVRVKEGKEPHVTSPAHNTAGTATQIALALLRDSAAAVIIVEKPLPTSITWHANDASQRFREE